MAYAYMTPSDPTDVLGRRITAYVIDGLLALVVFAVALALAHHQVYKGAPSDACAVLKARAASGSSTMCLQTGSHVAVWSRGSFIDAYGLAVLVSLLNVVVLQALTGASAGKHALGLRVVDDRGMTAGFGRMVVRGLMLVIDGVCFLVGLITAVVTHPHRRVGDLAAGTYVVAKESVGRPITIARAPDPFAAGYAVPGYAPRPTPGWDPTAPQAPAPQRGAAPVGSPVASAPPTSQWGAPPPPPPPPAGGPQWGTASAPAPPPSPTAPHWGTPPPPPAPPSAPAPTAPATSQWNPVVPPPPGAQPPPPPPPAPPTAPPPSAPYPSAPSPSAAYPSTPPAPPPPFGAPSTPPPAPPPRAPAPPAPRSGDPFAPPARPAPAPFGRPAPEPNAPGQPGSEPKPEAWWDKAIPADPADGEDPQS